MSPSASRVWLGARYRLSIVPAPVMRLLADAPAPFVLHAVSADVDLRFSQLVVTPSIAFTRAGTDTFLVGDGRGSSAPHLGAVKSDLLAVTAAVDLAWRTPLSHRVDLELGGSLGVVVLAGAFWTSWVHASPRGELVRDGKRYAPCAEVDDGVGCRPQDHGQPTPVRVGWLGGDVWSKESAVPPVLPWISFPQVSVRALVARDVAVRVGAGVSLAGVWIAAGAYWGPFGS